MPGADAVSVIDDGKKRHIPDPFVYNELFSTWSNIHLDVDINDIDTGAQIPQTALLFRTYDSPKVFLLDGTPPNLVKRWIVSPAVMDRFQFNWGRIHLWNVPLAVIGIPDGSNITQTGRPD